MNKDDLSQFISKLDELEFVLSSAAVTPEQRSMSIAISLSLDIISQLKKAMEAYATNQ